MIKFKVGGAYDYEYVIFLNMQSRHIIVIQQQQTDFYFRHSKIPFQILFNELSDYHNLLQHGSQAARK